MKSLPRTTLIFSPKPRFGRELGRLVEAIAERVPVKAGKSMNEIEVSTKDAPRVTRILKIHGYDVVDKRLHEANKSKLAGALEKLSEKYDLSDDRPKKVTPPPSLHKRKVMNYVNSKARKARQMRTKTRVQHKRDRLDGRIEALDDMIRYLRKK